MEKPSPYDDDICVVSTRVDGDDNCEDPTAVGGDIEPDDSECGACLACVEDEDAGTGQTT